MVKQVHVTRLFIGFLIVLSVPLPFVFNSCSGTGFSKRDLDSKLKSVRTLLIVNEQAPVDILFIIDNSASITEEQIYSDGT